MEYAQKLENEYGGAGTEKLQKILVCDSEERYGERLVEYLNGNLAFPCEIERYTSATKLEELGQMEKTSLVIISEREFRKTQKTPPPDKLLILNETGTDLGEEIHSISKYQSMDIVLEMVRVLTLKKADVIPGMIRHGNPMKLIGFYTPITRCLQTTFALTFGQLLARKHRVLYLNFENYAGFDYLMQYKEQGTVSDLLYYNECAREKLTAQLGLLIKSMNGLDYIPPMKSFEELHSVQCRQWLSLFKSFERVTEYEYVLLDLSESAEGLFEMMRACELIYTVTRDDAFSRAKIDAYEQLLRASHGEDIAAKTRRCRFPVFQALPAALDHLTHGEMAEFVCRIMEEEGWHVDG